VTRPGGSDTVEARPFSENRVALDEQPSAEDVIRCREENAE
jgi:hypothetical protein